MLTKWGILGSGGIARQFARQIHMLPDAKLTAVGSRTIEKAKAFAEENGVEKFYGTYEETIGDSQVDAIYIASPHSKHEEDALACMNAGKPILCEKPMAVNASQVQNIISCAHKNDVFCMEAMWTRFLPVMIGIRKWLSEKRIGDVNLVIADFGFRDKNQDPKGRLFNPDLAGGSILDVGVYTIAFSFMVFGSKPVAVNARGAIGKTKVDELCSAVLSFSNGRFAQITSSLVLTTPHIAWIIGTRGKIRIPRFWRAEEATLFVENEEPVTITGDSGLRFEAQHMMECLAQGKKESDIMPLQESLEIAQTMDTIREQVGVRYPFEQDVGKLNSDA